VKRWTCSTWLLAWSIDSDPEYLAKLAHNLGALKQEGLIRCAVADSFSGERLYLAMLASGAFDAVNIDLNLADACGLRRVVPAAHGARLGVIAREAFFKGELFHVGAACGIEDRSLLARVAIKWVAQQRPECVIVGVDNAEQLAANAAALESPPFSEEELAAVTRLRAAPNFAEYEIKKRNEFLETTL
jgi:aryl-alcohol dehydrogenase-like predicted oxidoreductase